MSIFVSVPTEHDPEIFFTIRDIFSKAAYPQEIYVGLACMTDKEYYEKILQEFGNNPNITIKWFDQSIEENIGVGVGRNSAIEMYNGQDHILQIDSHTLFDDNWDTILINLYQNAILESGNKKTILTSYLPQYKHTEFSGRVRIGKIPMYCLYETEKYFDRSVTKIPRWDLISISSSEMQNSKYKNIKFKSFLPAQKINAQFMFSGKEFFNHYGLPREVFFFEEETIQSINLMDAGYSFVWPNSLLPLCHLYGNDAYMEGSLAKRHKGCGDDLWEKKYSQSGSFYIDFINNKKNKKKCKIFKKYANIDLLTGAKEKIFIPKSY